MAQGYAAAKQWGIDIEKILPADDTMRDLAKDFNLNPVERGGDDTGKEVTDLKEQIKWMMPISKGTPPAEMTEETLTANV